MGSLYFILKNSIITIVIVCLLQIQFSNKTLEDRLMDFVRQSVAPKFLGAETNYIKTKSLKMTPADLGEIRRKIYGSAIFSGLKKNAQEVLLKEMTDVIKSSNEKKIKELEALENQKGK